MERQIVAWKPYYTSKVAGRHQSMKLRYFDKLQDVIIYPSKLIGVGAKILIHSDPLDPRLHSAWMWEIFRQKIKLGWTNNYLIVFYPECFVFNVEQFTQVQANILRSEDLSYFLRYDNRTFVLESCPAIKVPQILQLAFPDAHFAWKPFDHWEIL